MQIITGTSLVAGLASSTSILVSGASCVSTITTTITVATTTITLTPGVEPSRMLATSLSHTTIISGSCDAPVSATPSAVSAWTKTHEVSPTGSAAWTLSTYTSVNPSNPAQTLTSTHCVSGQAIAGINTEEGPSGTSYLVCAVSTASYPTVGTITGKSTADAAGATHASSRFTFFPTGPANITTGPTAGTGTAVVAPTNSIVPFTGGAASINSKKALVALAGVTVAMLFV